MKLYLKASIFLLTITVVGQTSLQELYSTPGSYAVGFQHYGAVDSSRTYSRLSDWTNEKLPRPIPVSVWYPAEKNSAINTRKILDYMRILKNEEEWEHLPDEQILNWFYYANTPENQEHLTRNTRSFLDVTPASGKYPVVIYAPSYQASSIENFALCELLASHGYVGFSSPSRGHDYRYFQGGTAKDAEAQARDVEFLMIQAKKHPSVDFDKMGAMGFSFGGMSTMNAKMRNTNIKALVSLAGTERYVYETLEKSPYFNLGNINVPYIHLSQKKIPKQVLEEDNIDPELNTKFDLYDSITKSKVYRLKMHHLSHSYFSTLGVLFQTRDTRKDKSDAEIMKSYQWLSQYALQFFNAYLKQDETALKFLENTPEANGVAEGIIGKMQKEPVPKALSFQDFNEMAAKQEYEDLIPLFQNLQKENPSLSFREIRLNNLGLQLMFHPGKTEQSIKVFLLATYLYPESANLFDSLAEAYLYANKPKEAIVAFEKSLALNPENMNAVNRLKELKK